MLAYMKMFMNFKSENKNEKQEIKKRKENTRKKIQKKKRKTSQQKTNGNTQQNKAKLGCPIPCVRLEEAVVWSLTNDLGGK